MSMNNPTQTPPSRKRLLLISQYFPVHVGGAEQQVYHLAQYLRSIMDIHFLTLSNRPLESQEAGITLWTIPCRRRLHGILGPCYLLDSSRLWEVLQRVRPDIIYTQYAGAHLGIAARYARSGSCTLIWHIASSHDVQPFRRGCFRTLPFDYLDKRLGEYGIRHADYIFGQAQYEQDLLQQNYGRTCDLIVGNWHPAPSVSCTKEPPVKVVWVANIKPLKKPELFVELAARLSAVTGAEFLMIGRPGSARQQRRLEALMRNVRGLTYLGEQSNDRINRILGASHLLVNTSDYEGFPNTFVQAWLHEVPVVSLHADPDHVLTRQGLGFHSGSLDRLVQDTRNLIENAALRTRIGKKAQAYARAHHDLGKNLGRVAAFLERILGAGASDAHAGTVETWASARDC